MLSGKVIMINSKNNNMKKEVMKNKNKLKGESIFVEHDLMWHKRKIQEKIKKMNKR